jgi:hypothetical protein
MIVGYIEDVDQVSTTDTAVLFSSSCDQQHVSARLLAGPSH